MAIEDSVQDIVLSSRITETLGYAEVQTGTLVAKDGKARHRVALLFARSSSDEEFLRGAARSTDLVLDEAVAERMARSILESITEARSQRQHGAPAVNPGPSAADTESGGEVRTDLDEVIRRFLNHSFGDIGFAYAGLTPDKKALCTEAEFTRLVHFANGGRRG